MTYYFNCIKSTVAMSGTTNHIFKKKQLFRNKIGMILTCLLVFLYLRVNLVLSVMKIPSTCSVNQRWIIKVRCLVNFRNICVRNIRSIKINPLVFLRTITKLMFLNLVSFFFKILLKVLLKMILQYCFH